MATIEYFLKIDNKIRSLEKQQQQAQIRNEFKYLPICGRLMFVKQNIHGVINMLPTKVFLHFI